MTSFNPSSEATGIWPSQFRGRKRSQTQLVRSQLSSKAKGLARRNESDKTTPKFANYGPSSARRIMVQAFFAYPGSERDIVRAVHDAKSILDKPASPIDILLWEENDISGRPLTDPMFDNIA